MRVIVDATNFAYKSIPRLKADPIINAKGQNITVPYCVIGYTRDLLNQFEVEELTFCYDGRSAARTKLLPDYKGQREETTFSAEIKAGIKVLKSVLGHFGIKQLYYDDLEADDIIGVLSQALSGIRKEVLIVSGDKDMLQLITPCVSVYSPVKKQTITHSNFEKIMGMPLMCFSDYLCIDGDEIDNIPGIPKVGPATAKWIFAKYGHYDTFLSKEDEVRMLATVGSAQDRKFARLALPCFEQKNIELIQKNRQLIKLGSNLSLEQKKEIITAYSTQAPVFNMNAVAEFFKEYQLLEYLHQIQDFQCNFNGIQIESAPSVHYAF